MTCFVCLDQKSPAFFDPNLEFRVSTSSAYDCGLRITSSPKHKEKEEVVLPPAGSEITIAQALEIAEAVGETGTENKYLITGTIKTVTNPQYGEMYITDGENELYIYGTYSADGVKRYSELTEKPVKGDTVTLLGSLKLLLIILGLLYSFLLIFSKKSKDC